MAIDYLHEFGPVLQRLAAESGEILVRYFQDRNFVVEAKADASPVTIADRMAEECLRKIVAQEFPTHGVIAEEFGNVREDAEFVWVFDPIDGTVSFVSGCPLFGTLIGLLHHGEPVLGCIHQPVTGQMVVGDNNEALLNGQLVKVRGDRKLEEAILLTTDLRNVALYQEEQGFGRLRDRCRLFRTWGDCYGYLLLATGGADIMMDPVLNPWDLLPLIPIIRGAGGVITGWDGTDPVKSGSCIAASAALHPQVLEILHRNPTS